MKAWPTRERKKEREEKQPPLLMKSDESMTIFALPPGSLSRPSYAIDCIGNGGEEDTSIALAAAAVAVGGSDSAKLSALPKNLEIHLRSARNPVQLHQSSQTPRSIKDSLFATPAATWVSDLGRERIRTAR